MTTETNIFRFSTSFGTGRLLPPPAPASGENEFATFAEQFTHRAERLREARAADPSRYSIDAVTDIGTPRHTAEMWAAALLLTGLTAATVLVWSWPTKPVTSSTSAIAGPKAPVEAQEEMARVAVPLITMPGSESSRTTTEPEATLPQAATPGAPLGSAATGASPVVSATPIANLVEATPPPPSAPAAVPAKALDATPLSWTEASELQTRLKVAGFNPGPIDGIVGPLTRDAARRYIEARTLVGTTPTKDMLARLRSEAVQSAELPPY
jgi:hypothetical protein